MSKKRSKIDLIFEKIPPIITFTLIFLPLWGGFMFPFATAYFVIIFNVFFLYKSISFAIYFALSLLRIRHTENIDWLSRLNELDNLDSAIELLLKKQKEIKNTKYSPLAFLSLSKAPGDLTVLPEFLEKVVFSYLKNKALRFVTSEIKRLNNLKVTPPFINWKEMQHIVVIPHYKEPFHILEQTLIRISKNNYPTKNISIVLGAEARDTEGIKISKKLQNKFQDIFGNIWINSHVLTEDEIVGKSSNMASAGKYAYTKIAKKGWDLKKVTVTSCDADSQLPANYFADVTYKYITTKDSEYKFFNGAMILYANIWRLPFYARVKNSMSTIYNVGRLIRTDKLVPFSTYTTSFWLIKSIGYWTPDITPEDFHIFFKASFKFKSKVETIPIFQKVFADAAEGETHLETIKNNYFQERRWSWGVSDDGWVLKNLFKMILSRNISWIVLYRGLHIVFDHILGPVSSIIILFGGNIPLLINPQFAATTTGVNLPRVSSFMIQITIWFLIITILLDQFLKPKRPGKQTLIRRLLGFAEWILQPVIGFIMVALPGIEAHTRLLFGKYLEYYLTKKK